MVVWSVIGSTARNSETQDARLATDAGFGFALVKGSSNVS